jgi:predicted dinucleotide-binding enzyme
MKVAIIGTGKMGRGFAQALAVRHEVVVGSRDPSRAREIATKTGAAGGASYADASAGADVAILTVPWQKQDAEPKAEQGRRLPGATRYGAKHARQARLGS